MTIESVPNLYYVLLFVVGLISFISGFFVMKKSQSLGIGYCTLFGVSIILLVLVFNWFQSAAVDVYMGTIPWLYNQALAIILYLLYLIITWFVLKAMNNRRTLA